MPEATVTQPTEAMAAPRRWRRAAAWPLVLAAVITWESVSAIPGVGPSWLEFDKLAHFGVFGLLATTLARLEAAQRWPLLRELWAVVLVSVYGLAIEIMQGFTTIRSMEFGDWVADTLGAALAVALYLRWTWYRRRLEQPLRRRRQPRIEISAAPVPNLPA
ncbi:MAG TPA: VanZ family protein [Opitutaceae bacterium]|nr:VanZ family protein [Opitutaceae bacterium]